MNMSGNWVSNQQPASMYPTQMPTAPPAYNEPTYPVHAPVPDRVVYVRPFFSRWLSSFNRPASRVPAYTQPPYRANQPATPTVQINLNTPAPEPVVAGPLPPHPALVRCSQCQMNVFSITEEEPNCTAHLCCLLLFAMACFPCSCIPYCVDSMKNVRHFCPNCHTYLGSFEP